ncbi:MAG TPA: methionyl-tRNA formyltransferase [Clostridiales bacterium]|nr:methionyl-tRNA formyltransferase [Clostridiales bacterium]
MRIVFLGTPDFAVKPFENIIENGYNVVAAITNPDKPVGRKQTITACPVKETALRHGIPVYQYTKIRNEGVEDLKALKPDLMVTCAFGQILSQEILDIPTIGTINIHASLLPKYRGSSPIQWAIINGEKVTGITIMFTDVGVDTGDIILQDELQIEDTDTAGTLFDKLSVLGSRSVIKALEAIETGTYTRTKQDETKATHTKFFNKESGLLDFNKTADEIVNLVRGLNPWPVAYFMYKGEKIQVYSAENKNSDYNAEPGTVVSADKKTGLIVNVNGGSVRLKTLKKSGGKLMPDTDFLNGNRILPGEKLF